MTLTKLVQDYYVARDKIAYLENKFLNLRDAEVMYNDAKYYIVRIDVFEEEVYLKMYSEYIMKLKSENDSIVISLEEFDKDAYLLEGDINDY